MQNQGSTPRRALSAFVGVFALSIAASAQQFPSCPVPGSTGPDVIVGDLNGVQNYAPASGMDALSLGTTSCNIGTVWLNWFANAPQHPVIGGGAFKYSVVNGAGRFEELGQSWLKHGFYALSDTLCCSNCQPTDGTHLGIGCSDPYDAARNGDQGGLGPKYQVNANTGAFIYPHPSPVGGNNGRIQIDQTLLQNSSASIRYFGEMQYVTPDDAANNNNDNNCSYRELSYNGVNFGFIGGTQRMQSGIEAWRAVDPLVNQQTITAPESSGPPFDGTSKLILSSRVTDLGGGLWHYEYALYNMNSDRAISSFSLPIPAGLTVVNIGFHDVAYLGGDGGGGVNYDGTDWVGTVAGGSITWATNQTFAQNQNANALRWGTTYNFRFDANSPPISGTADLGQFKVVNNIAVANVDVPSSSFGSGFFVPFCRGDGSEAPCPCGNTGNVDHGCASSLYVAGGQLTATGSASVSNDTMVLSGTLMSGSSAVFFCGDAQMAPVVVDDGLGCVTGSVVRLGTKSLSFAAASFPGPGDPTISVRSAVPGAGGTRFIQCFYRNAAAAFCPPLTSNRTNGIQIVYGP